ncbi:hybrid sensor histidine kinase/response regulator [Brevundimonas denitrificans]|uniref:histidine kinase n=1 Tax=Brevundimonas denitrificans TaxID=1443434 RepID=A0ABQ6BN88_9CAUL|nr:PAS domain-containing protein [Brevundimonas denitrificans]GLS01338.1 hybrid sensor histidine kinase/response regulator [Brevundimonas denitrificans]
MGAQSPQESRKATTEPLNLDSPFERLTALARAMFDTPHAMVGVIDGEQTLFRANVGLDQTGLPRELTATHLMVAMGPGAVLIVEDGLKDERVRNHPMVVGAPFLRFFAGVTIANADGEAVGAIGVMDIRPRARPTDAEIENLKVLARMAGELIDRAEIGRRQSEQLKLLKLAEEMAGVGQWRMDAETLKSTWSDQVYRIYGVTREAFDPNLGDAIDFFHPGDRETLRQAVTHALATGEGFRIRARLVRADGEERLVDAHADTERGSDGRVESMFGVFQDVTEAVRAEHRLAESEQRHRLLADRATDIIITYGVDGLVTYVSPSIERVSGHRPQDVVGRPVTDLIHPEDVPALAESFREFVKAPPEWALRGVTYRGLVKDGGCRWFEARTSIIRDDEGRVIEFQDLVRDVTETKRLEEALIEARDRAEAGARAKSEFLANMSHELRTPLTSVIGFSGLLQQSTALPETERRYADRIGTASEALLGVINDILDYSKLEAGAVEMEARAFDPRALTQAAAAMVEGQCEVKGLGLAVKLDPGLPTALTGDEGRLRQVMLNFLANAAKFTSQGFVTLEASWTGERLRVAVTDTGIGIAADKIDTLFERFSQADNSTTRVYGGTGLGLSISRRLVEMMGGEIGAESRIGEGSTFWFEVPLTPAEAMATDEQAGGETASPDGLRILVADDAAANRELVVAILGAQGVALETVEDGARAVEAARGGGYDLILMDVHMPVMDGLDATRAIRALDGEAGRVPIVALTANVQPEQVLRCREAGMDDHVGKPIQVAELLRVIAARLEQRASVKASQAA